MCAVRRLEILTGIVGQQLVAKHTQRNFLQQFGEKLQVWHRSVVFETVCTKASFLFLQKGRVMTASLNCKGTDPDNTDSFTIRQKSKALSHLSTFSTKWSGLDREHSVWGQNHISVCEPTIATLAQSHKIHCKKRVRCRSAIRGCVNQVHCE